MGEYSRLLVDSDGDENSWIPSDGPRQVRARVAVIPVLAFLSAAIGSAVSFHP